MPWSMIGDQCFLFLCGQLSLTEGLCVCREGAGGGAGKGRGGGSEGRVGGGRLALSPSGPRRKRAEKLLSLNPLGTEGADWLSASNIGRGGGGGGG